MTITDIRTRVPAQRPADTTTTPESRRIAELNAMLDNADYAGYHTELRAARDELVALTATTALAA